MSLTAAAAEGRSWDVLTPAEGDCPGSVGSLLDQWFVEFAARSGMDLSPARLTIVLQAGDVGAEERRELAPASRALALVTELIVQYVRLHLHLWQNNRNR